MNRLPSLSLAGLVLSASLAAHAATVVPAFDLSGTWQSAGGSTASYFQESTRLNWINISGGFTHEFSAPSAGPPPWYVYEFTPEDAYAVMTKAPGGATRWTF